MGYKACNEVLQKLYADCCTAPADQSVRAPWGVSLNGTGRFAAVAAIRNRFVGVARNSAGKYKLYHREAMSGNWLFEIWPLWKSSILLAVFATLFSRVDMLDRGFEQVAALAVLGVVGVILFGCRAICFSGSYVAGSIAGGRSYVLGVYPSVFGLAVSVSCFVTIYAMSQGFAFRQPVEWWSVVDFSIEVSKTFFLVWAGSACASLIAEACGFGVVSVETMAEDVMDGTNNSQTLFLAANQSGLRRQYEETFPAANKGGNIVVILTFAVVLLFVAAWPLMYVV